MDVSVIIVNWNTKKLLQDCLTSIYKEAGKVHYEVIVVDNASSDGSAEMVRSEFPAAKLIVEQTNRGYAAGVNDGIRIAQGKYVLVLNSDTLICDTAIEKTIGYADKHEEAAVIGCQVRESRDKVQMTCFRFPSLLNLFLRTSGLARFFKYNRFFGRGDMRWWQRDSEREVDVVSGMFMLVRREAIRQVGLMDEEYFLYCEETDWCYRFAKAGWKRLFWPGARIIHVNGGDHSTNQAALKMFIQRQKSQLIFFRKNHGLYSYWLARLLLTLIFAQRVCLKSFILSYKRLLRRSTHGDVVERKKFWLAFKFCLSGRELV